MREHWRNWLRFIGVLLALGLALAAQCLFTQQPWTLPTPASWNDGMRFNAAIELLLAAMVVFAVTMWGTARPPEQTVPESLEESRPKKGLRALGPYLAAGCYLLAMFAYFAFGENDLTRWLWLGGIAILVLAQMPPRRALVEWVKQNRADWWEWALVAVIILAGFGLRFWRLTEIPSDLEGDISSIGLQSLEVIEKPNLRWFTVGWSEKPMFYYVMASWAMRLFGQNQFGLMMGSVIAGTLTILAVYLLGRELFGRRAGLIASALLAISYTHIHFSRIVITETASLFITLLFFFLFRGLRARQRSSFVLAGIALGLGLLTYYPARVGPVIVALLLAWILLWQRAALLAQWKNWAVFGLCALLGFGPMLGFALRDFDLFMGRASAVTLTSPEVRAHLMSKYNVTTVGEMLVEQAKRPFLTYHFFGDASTHFSFPGPMADALTAALLALGVGYALARLRNPKHFTLVVWMASALVLGGLMTNDPPYWPHLVITLPAVAVLAALAAERAWEGLARPLGRPGQWAMGALLIAALLYTGVNNWQTYYKQVQDNAGSRVRIARFVNALPKDHQIRMVSDSFSWQDREFQFLNRGRPGMDIAADRLRAETRSHLERPIVFIVTPEHSELLPILHRLYPNGRERQDIAPNGFMAFTSYTFTPAGYQPPTEPPWNYGVLVGRLLIGEGVILLIVAAAFLFARYRPAAERTLKLAIGNRPMRWKRRLSEWTPPRLSVGEIRKWLAVLGGPVLALGLAYLAQGLFDVHHDAGLRLPLDWFASRGEFARLWVAAGLSLAALAVWAITVPFKVAQPTRAPSEGSVEPLRAARPLVFRLVVLGLGLWCYLLSMALFAIQGEDSLVRWLWAGGLVLFLAAWLPWPWLRRSPHPEAEYSPPFRWANVVILVLILLAALWLRLYRLEVIPSDFHGDMASHGLEARDYLSGAEPRLFVVGWADMPRMTFFPAALFLRVFGNNLFGLQLTSVVGGMASLVGLYLLVWRLFDRHRLAALATAVMAINIPHIHFSRIADYMDPWPLAILALFLIVDGLRARRLISMALAGALLGLCFQLYFSGRVVPFIVGAFLLYAFFFHRQWVTRNWGGLGLLALGFLAALGPSLVFDLQHWGAFIERSREVYLFDPNVMKHLQNKYNVSSEMEVVLEQTKRSLLMFNYSIDSSTQFGFPHPMFSSLLAPLVALGLGCALRRWKLPGMMLILIWLAPIMAVGGAMTVDAPFWPRLVGILPVAGLAAALALDQLWDVVKGLWGRRAALALGVALTVFLVMIGWRNWNLYYETVRDNAHPQARIGRFLDSLPAEVAACNFADPNELRVRETQFLAWPRQLVDLPSDAPDAALDQCPGPPVVWILSPNHLDRLPVVRARWPNGITQEHYDLNKTHTFTSYLVWDKPPGATPVGQGGEVYISEQALLALTPLVVIFLLALTLRGVARDYAAKAAGPPPTPVTETVAAIPTSAAEVWQPALRLQEWLDRLNEWQPPALTAELARKLALVLAGPLAAVCLAYLAQGVYDIPVESGIRLGVDWFASTPEGQRLTIGTVIYVVAALVWVFTTPARAKDAPAVERKRPAAKAQPALSASSKLQPWAMVRVLGLICSAFAALYYWVAREDELVRWLWVSGALFFVLSLRPWRLMRRWFAPGPEASPPFKRAHVAVLAGILLLGFVLRVDRLDTLPLEISTDMASYGLVARSYLLGAEYHMVGEGWFYIPRVAFLPYAATLLIFGNNLSGLYMATVIMGVLNLLEIYLLVWRIFDRHRLAALTTFIAAINAGHIEYSRIAAFIDPWFYGFLALWLLVDGLRARRTASLALAGVAVGLGLQVYPAGRVIVLCMAVFLVYAYLFRRPWVTENGRGLVLAVIGALVVIGPNLIYFGVHWQTFIQRAQEVSTFDPSVMAHLKYTYNTDSAAVVVWEQVKRSLLMFNYYTDRSAHFGYPRPMFNSLLSPLLVLGLGYAVLRWRTSGMVLILASFGLILALGSVMTANAPTWSRVVGIIPLASLLIALSLDQLWDILARLKGEKLKLALAAAVGVFMAIVGIKEWDLYYQATRDYARPVVRVSRYLNTLPPQVSACGLLEGYALEWAEAQFMGWPRKLVDVKPDTPDDKLACPGPSFVWILSPEHSARLDALRARWPEGIVEEHRLLNGDLVFTSYLVPEGLEGY